MSDKAPYQVALPLHVYERHDLASFFLGDNAALVGQLQRTLQNSQSHEFFYLFGKEHCGKSHLLQALQNEFEGREDECFMLDLKLAKALGPEILNTSLPRVVLLDNVDSVAGDEQWELMLFSVFNRWTDAQTGVLVTTASCSFDKIAYLRRDLNTRLGSGICGELKYLNTEQCAVALQQKAELRGLNLSAKTAGFLVTHFNHDLAKLSSLLDKLEDSSLQAQRELTIPFIKQVIAASACSD
ncbi:MAG: hypothetical protein K6F05_00885 [Succinivibrio sp.]|nr:hypothetical protein [Succinivibrio sp.]